MYVKTVIFYAKMMLKEGIFHVTIMKRRTFLCVLTAKCLKYEVVLRFPIPQRRLRQDRCKKNYEKTIRLRKLTQFSYILTEPNICHILAYK